MLLSERNVPDVHALIIKITRLKHPNATLINPFFEHGHWFVRARLEDTARDYFVEYTYDVVDAIPGINGTSLALELLEEKEL